MTEQEKLTPLDVMRQFGRCRKGARGADGSVCVIAAVVKSDLLTWEQQGDYLGLIDRVIDEQFGNRGGCAVGFNEHPLTTDADVELVMDKAWVLFSEQVTS